MPTLPGIAGQYQQLLANMPTPGAPATPKQLEQTTQAFVEHGMTPDDAASLAAEWEGLYNSNMERMSRGEALQDAPEDYLARNPVYQAYVADVTKHNQARTNRAKRGAVAITAGFAAPLIAGAVAGGGLGGSLGASGARGVAGNALRKGIVDTGKDSIVTQVLGGKTSKSGWLEALGARNSDGSLNIPGAISLGTTALGGLGALIGTPDQPGAPAADTTTLAPSNYSRSRNAGPADYKSYGKSGGEHQFFNYGQGSLPTSGTDVPVAMADPRGGKKFIGPPLRPGLGRASGGRTPSTGTGGRTDDIEALLSEGEYVMDAESVALLGDGSTEAGFRKLDELRANLRQHKGGALANGEISPDAKPAEAYMAKGGKVPLSVVKGGMPKRSVEERMSELDALRRLVETHKMLKKEGHGPSANDPYNSGPLKKADGGAVAEARARVTKISDFSKKSPAKGHDPVKELVSFADRLEASLEANDKSEFEASMSGIETMLPGSRIPVQKAMAKGGKVMQSIGDWIATNFAKLGGDLPAYGGAERRIARGQPLHPENFPDQPRMTNAQAIAYLEALDPQSKVLQQIKEYEAAAADRDVLTKIREARARQVEQARAAQAPQRRVTDPMNAEVPMPGGMTIADHVAEDQLMEQAYDEFLRNKARGNQ